MPKLSLKSNFIGAHLSIGGGLDKSVQRAEKLGATALQIFTKNQRRWRAPALSQESIKAFKNAWLQWGPYPILSHDSYLVNLASARKEVRQKSLESMAGELFRAEALGIKSLVVHPGSHLGQGVKKGLELFTTGLDRAIELSGTEKIDVLLEITAGQGTDLGYSLEQLEEIMAKSINPGRLGICFDTCHAFASGYDFRSSEGYEKTMSRIQDLIGISNLRCFHLNDCKTPLGSRKDRHEHIGIGRIGLNGFSLIVNDSRFEAVPKILETPKGKDMEWDRMNLQTIVNLLPANQKLLNNALDKN